MTGSHLLHAGLIVALGLAATLAACDQMAQQPKDKDYADRDPANERVSPVPPAGTVARTDLTTAVPPVTLALLQRGQERFDIYCSPCHGRDGDGHGMIVERGFPQPPSYHIDRLRSAPVAHFVDVITNGYGAMYSYAARVDPADRWAIAAYIRALQASQNVAAADLPDDIRRQLK